MWGKTFPSEIRDQLEEEMGLAGGSESNAAGTASLFKETRLSDHERIVLERLRQDEATQLDALIENLDGELGSAENLYGAVRGWNLQAESDSFREKIMSGRCEMAD